MSSKGFDLNKKSFINDESHLNNQGKNTSEENNNNGSEEKNPPIIENESKQVSSDKEKYTRSDMKEIIEITLKEIQLKRKKLLAEVEELENKKSQIEMEIKSSFAGQSDSIARKVKGFKDYLTGALQDLSQSAEQLDFSMEPILVQPSPLDQKKTSDIEKEFSGSQPVAIADTFRPDEELIRECLSQFIEQPDFYAEPWKLRRSLEEKDLQLLEEWFFSMGGRGAQPSRGTRAKNVLLSAALISILGELYGDRFQTLVLASEPERLGEWRRGLQDALGLGREDFGPSSGIVLFERAEGLVETADRLEERGEVPLIIIDASERGVEIPVLQFPLWLAFAATPEELYLDEELM